MTTALTRLAGSAFELTVTIPWSEIKATYDKVFDQLAAEIEIEGFRKGKAPKDLVAGKIDREKIFSEVINQILPPAYSKALEEHGLKPIINPKVHILSGEEEKEWQFMIKSAEKPKVVLNDYKARVAELNAKGKIWTPTATAPADDKNADEAKAKKLEEIIQILFKICQVELPEILVETEIQRVLAQLIDDVHAAGLTYEQYLQAKNLTPEQLRQNYWAHVSTTLKLEFILEAIAEDLGIVVENSELAEVLTKETDPAKRAVLEKQSYQLAAVIRREKTLTKLTVL